MCPTHKSEAFLKTLKNNVGKAQYSQGKIQVIRVTLIILTYHGVAKVVT